jgi:hypothetical protein
MLNLYAEYLATRGLASSADPLNSPKDTSTPHASTPHTVAAGASSPDNSPKDTSTPLHLIHASTPHRIQSLPALLPDNSPKDTCTPVHLYTSYMPLHRIQSLPALLSQGSSGGVAARRTHCGAAGAGAGVCLASSFS